MRCMLLGYGAFYTSFSKIHQRLLCTFLRISKTLLGYFFSYIPFTRPSHSCPQEASQLVVHNISSCDCLTCTPPSLNPTNVFSKSKEKRKAHCIFRSTVCLLQIPIIWSYDLDLDLEYNAYNLQVIQNLQIHHFFKLEWVQQLIELLQQIAGEMIKLITKQTNKQVFKPQDHGF